MVKDTVNALKRWLILVAYIIVLLLVYDCSWKKRVQGEFVVQDVEGAPIASAEVYLLRHSTYIIPDVCQPGKEHFDHEELRRSRTRSSADGNFRLDMQLYHPHRCSILVVADGYRMTMLPLVTNERRIVLLDRTKSSIAEKVETSEALRGMRSGGVWDNLHGVNPLRETDLKSDLMYAACRLPAVSYASVYDGYGWMCVEECSALKRLFDIPLLYHSDQREEVCASLQQDEQEILRRLVEKEPNAYMDFLKYIPIFYQHHLTPEQRRLLNLPANLPSTN